MSTTNIPEAEAQLKEIIALGDLTAYAAAAALKELHKNWECAVGDGTPIAGLIHDIDLTIGRLTRYKQGLEVRLEAKLTTKEYVIPIVWMMQATITVEADSLEAAVEKASDHDWPEGEYARNSWQVDGRNLCLMNADEHQAEITDYLTAKEEAL